MLKVKTIDEVSVTLLLKDVVSDHGKHLIKSFHGACF